MAANNRGLRFAAANSSHQQEYLPLLPAASSFNSSKKYVLNAKNDAVEVLEIHHPNHGGGGGGEIQLVHPGNHSPDVVHHNNVVGYGGDARQQQLTRYNSAPSSFFSELDQIASSSNNNNCQSAKNIAMYDSPLDLHQHHHHQRSTTSRFSQSSTGIVSLGDVHMRTMVDPVGGGFTGLLNSAAPPPPPPPPPPPSAAPLLVRQSSSPASFLEIEQQQQQQQHQQNNRSSEEDSPLLRSPSTNDELGGSDHAFWDNSSSSQVFMNHHRKRTRDMDMDLDGGPHHSNVHQLTRHLSLPISTRASSSSMAAADNMLHDSVPCRLRAKRGCATHPRSIAERLRRTKISDRMRQLQQLVPNSDKQTNTSDMLDEAVEYVKLLKRQVEELSDCREKCQGLCKASQNGHNHSPS